VVKGIKEANDAPTGSFQKKKKKKRKKKMEMMAIVYNASHVRKVRG
jgi:hypothetical protein